MNVSEISQLEWKKNGPGEQTTRRSLIQAVLALVKRRQRAYAKRRLTPNGAERF